MSSYAAPIHSNVVAGRSADELRRAIDLHARGFGHRTAEVASQAFVESPLQAAVRMHRPDLVGVLLEAGADAKPLYDGLATPLAVCALHGTVESLRALLRAGNHDPAEQFRYDTNFYFGRTSCTSTLAHLCVAPPQASRNNAFSLASLPAHERAPRLEMLEVLIREGGADVDARDEWGRTPLMWLPYASADHEAALDLLLRLGADVNARSWTRSGEPRSKPDDTPLTALISHFRGSRSTLMRCVRKLVTSGAQTSGVFDAEGRTPLGAAMEAGKAAVVRFLVEELRAPVNERDPDSGCTALRFAFGARMSPEAVQLLLDAGADVEARDSDGRTPVFWSAREDEAPGGMRLLLERGASSDSVDGEGNTPLMLACEWRDGTNQWSFDHPELAELLLRHSSRETLCAARPSDGLTALDCVVEGLRTLDEAAGSSEDDEDMPPRPLHRHLDGPQRRVLSAMLAAGAPCSARNAPVLLPCFVKMVAPRAERAAVEMAARVSAARRWRAHEAVVALALDAKEAREAEAEVEAAERRVAALERRLRERDEEQEEDDDDDAEEEKGVEEGGDGDGNGE